MARHARSCARRCYGLSAVPDHIWQVYVLIICVERLFRRPTLVLRNRARSFDKRGGLRRRVVPLPLGLRAGESAEPGIEMQSNWLCLIESQLSNQDIKNG